MSVALVLDNLWCHVLWGSAECVGSLIFLDLLDEPKVSKFKVACVSDENILRLQISVDQVFGVKVVEHLDNLSHVESCMLERQLLVLVDDSHEIATCHKFSVHVDDS